MLIVKPADNMCKNCEENSVVLPKGDPGANGVDGIGTNGVNGTEENVAFDTSFNIIYTSLQFIDSYPLDNLGTPDLTAYRIVGRFIFPGTNNLNGIIPNKLYITGLVTDNNPTPGNNKWLVRVRNSSDVIIAESTLIVNPTIALIDLGTVSNLPITIDAFTIEVFLITQTNPQTIIYLNSLLLTKE